MEELRGSNESEESERNRVREVRNRCSLNIYDIFNIFCYYNIQIYSGVVGIWRPTERPEDTAASGQRPQQRALFA